MSETHDQIVRAAKADPNDINVVHVLADAMDDARLPGQHLAREATARTGGLRRHGVPLQIPGYRNSETLTGDFRRLSPNFEVLDPTERRFTHSIRPFIRVSGAANITEGPPVYLHVGQLGGNNPDNECNMRDVIHYLVPVYSKAHLEHLMSDWPASSAYAKKDKNDLRNQLARFLPDTHAEQMSRRKMARPGEGSVHVGPGEPILGTDFIHPIHDETGNKIGHVWVTPKDNGQTLHINHVGVTSGMAEGGNTLGAAHIISARRQLRSMYPAAKRFTGTRISGAKQEAPEAQRKVSVGIGRLQRKVVKFAGRRPFQTSDALVQHAAHALDNPLESTALMSFADHLSERHPDNPSVQRFVAWTQGLASWRDMVPDLKLAKYRPYGPYDPPLPPHPSGRPWDDPEFELAVHDGSPIRTLGVPSFGRSKGETTWHRRVLRARPMENEYSRLTTRRVRGRPLSTLEVAHHVYSEGGPESLINAVIGARYFHPSREGDKSGRMDSVHMSRLPKKYAKVDGHVVAHPLVQGFPIEHALRHLANDPKNHSNVRDLAKTALTGGETGDATPTALWMLNDALEEHVNEDGSKGHPLHKVYNWMSAADKTQLDQHTYTALTESANDEKKRQQVQANRVDWHFSPEHQAVQANWGMEKHRDFRGTQREQHHIAILNRVRQRTADLSGVNDQKAIDESIKRHGYRAHTLWFKQHVGPSLYSDKRALETLEKPRRGDHYKIKEKSTRYRRPKRYSGEVARSVNPLVAPENIEQTPPELLDDLHHQHANMIAVYEDFARRAREKGQENVAQFAEALADEHRGRKMFIRRHMQEVGQGWPRWAIATKGLPDPTDEHYAKGWDTIRKAVEGSRRSAGNVTAKRPPQLMKRRLPPKRYSLSVRGDFLDSLRRIKSSNQAALHQTAQEVAQRLGLHPIKVFNALHDTPTGSVPGIAQAVYGGASPEQIHAAASWIGLTANIPGVAVFHPRPAGPDMLHRLRQDGAGMDIRTKLDRVGLTNRVLIPHAKGFDILIPDHGGSLASTVQQYAQMNKLAPPQMSPGFFHEIGSNDQAQARASFRNKVVQSEKMKRRGFKVSYSHEAFLEAIKKDPRDTATRKVFADWLEEHAPETTTPTVIDRLRNYEGPMWVGKSPKGKVNAIPHVSKSYFEQLAAKSPWGTPSGEFFHISSRNNKGQAHRVRVSGKMQTWKRDPNRFRVPWKHGLYNNGEFNESNTNEFLIDDPTQEPT